VLPPLLYCFDHKLTIYAENMLYLLDRYLIMSTVQCQIAKKFLMFAVGGNGYETTHCLQIDNASLEVYGTSLKFLGILNRC